MSFRDSREMHAQTLWKSTFGCTFCFGVLPKLVRMLLEAVLKADFMTLLMPLALGRNVLLCFFC